MPARSIPGPVVAGASGDAAARTVAARPRPRTAAERRVRVLRVMTTMLSNPPPGGLSDVAGGDGWGNARGPHGGGQRGQEPRRPEDDHAPRQERPAQRGPLDTGHQA